VRGVRGDIDGWMDIMQVSADIAWCVILMLDETTINICFLWLFFNYDLNDTNVDVCYVCHVSYII
jgi:hypothetical protein